MKSAEQLRWEAKITEIIEAIDVDNYYNFPKQSQTVDKLYHLMEQFAEQCAFNSILCSSCKHDYEAGREESNYTGILLKHNGEHWVYKPAADTAGGHPR